MNKLSKLAFIAATAVMAASASAQSVPASRQAVNDNWVNGTGEWVWMNGTNELCWRDAFWTPATANAKCDGALVAQAPAPAPVAPVAPAITSQKITYQADTLFDFDKAVLKPAGKQKLDELAAKIQGMNVEVVVATGYTDRIGSDKYNDRLSLRRAQAVKSYLVSKGVPANKVYTEGKGKRNPVTGNTCKQKNRKQLIACLAPDRRVEVEVVGTQEVQKTTVPAQ
ncbi:OmpA family protein [Burkholderia pseudomallei]|uniref:Outer membrane protein a n=10 Tax=pseudomallei group TaxID=111527 RepID=Q63RZ9_BURPS|nr:MULTISPECIES: OmpA family protein [Burkholderia]EIF68363.1 outer membrane protein a precursor [Burkholderia pseudomallei 1258a]KGW52186.1 ompA family protein [Burkholderia pseudomallei MSHR684]KGX78148.1 ompA family protein [Burkholderia pseudomallei MSHR435]AAU48811.1 OmpA family protein [Burkholderia mallei ATCC 23344]ABA50896.1 outer membrane protein a precursor [Burkholderia pseudomallei 1710b]